MKKFTHFLVVVGVFSLLSISCSKQDEEIKNQELISFETEHEFLIDLSTNEVFSVGSNDKDYLKSPNLEKHTLKFVFEPSATMPNFESEKELQSFLLNKMTETNGSFRFFLDNKLIYKGQVIDGKKTNAEGVTGLSTKNFSKYKEYPCSYAGVRQCAIDGIDNQNWYEMSICVIEGLGCVAEWYLNCTIDNC